MNKLETWHKKATVIKNNKLIEFKGRLTTNELKLFGLIMANVHENQTEDLEKYVIDVSELKGYTRDKNFYGYLQETAFGLENKRILVEYMEGGKEKRYPLRLIYRPIITRDSKMLEFYLDKNLVPYILEFKSQGYTRYQLENVLRMKSSYSIRIYELLKQYQNMTTDYREFSLEELKEYLGIDPEEYTKIFNFEKWVLKVAEKEINEYTDIKITYEKIKKGKRVARIRFNVEYADKKYREYLEQAYNIPELKSKMGLEKERFNSQQIMELYSAAVDKTQDKVDVFLYIKLNYMHMILNNSARNKFAYLKKALENDYAKAFAQLRYSYRVHE